MGHAQSTFAEGRSTIDNILFIHEIFKCYIKKWISPKCILKFYLRKAPNTIKWSFLRKLSVDMGFPAKCIEWILTCVFSVSYSLLINGGLTPPFRAKRGLRQGEPMSLYLFVLAMEYLRREMSMLSHNGDFNFYPRCSKLDSVRICFADDFLMYCWADIISVRLVHAAFKRFSLASRLHANNTKSALYIAGVTQHIKEEMLEELEFEEGGLPFRYLGVPLDTKNISVYHYLPLIVCNKVTCWLAKLLSYARRVQLIKSVLFGVEAYWA